MRSGANTSSSVTIPRGCIWSAGGTRTAADSGSMSRAAESVNCWPNVGFDVGALTGACAALLPAGFYYKTFKWPSWHWFEPAIRRMAGLGRAPTAPDADHYEEVAADADVLVIGAGVAGLAAAAAAARAGAHTLLLASGWPVGGARSWGADPGVAGLAAG